MDPDLVLNQLRGAIVALDVLHDSGREHTAQEIDDLASIIAEHAFNLDIWMINGGALPKSWSEKR